MNQDDLELVRQLDELDGLQVVELYQKMAGHLEELSLDSNLAQDKNEELKTLQQEVIEAKTTHAYHALPAEVQEMVARLTLKELISIEGLREHLQESIDNYSSTHLVGDLSDLIVHISQAVPLILLALNTRVRVKVDSSLKWSVDFSSGDRKPGGIVNAAKLLLDTVRGDKARHRTVSIFIASSNELLKERDAIELELRRYTDTQIERGIYFRILRWESGPQQVSKTRLQDEYNKMVRNAEVALCLFATKVGMYTEEEFDTAYDAMMQNENGLPLIYTYFKRVDDSDTEDSLNRFRNRLQELGHFEPYFSSTADLINQFRNQLDQKINEGVL